MDFFLTIAASDNSGGAGIQQDIKVAQDLDYWALSAITGITVQNFNLVNEIEAVNSGLLKSQIEQCFLSFTIKAVKIGAICNKENLVVIADCLKRFPNENVVLDPVLFSSSGKSFLDNSALTLLQEALFPLTRLITPNKIEFELLVNKKTKSIDEAIEIAIEKSKEWNTSILLKGGHFNDTLIKEAIVTKTDIYRFERERKIFHFSHGTGCTLSSAIACYLGKNLSLNESYQLATNYLLGFYGRINKKLLP